MNTNQTISVETVQVALRTYIQLAIAYRPNSLEYKASLADSCMNLL